MVIFWNKIKRWWHRLSSPVHFYHFAGKHLTWTSLLAVILYLSGLIWGLAFAPADYLQGNSFRIIYLHVPAAALSMGVYVSMAICCLVGLTWKIKLAFMVARSMAIIGAVFTVIALFTGSVWGKPTWGTWWVWDARLTSELILLFLYLGFLGLNQALPDRSIANKSSAILAIVGVINIPIIHYSVIWWQSLHQGSSIFKFAKPSISNEMLWPLLIMLLAFSLIVVSYVFLNTRAQILNQRLRRS